MHCVLTRQISHRKLYRFSYLRIIIHLEDFLCKKLPFYLTCPDLNYLGLNFVTCHFNQNLKISLSHVTQQEVKMEAS